MKIRVAALCLLVLSSLISARGQSHENYRTFLTQQVRSPKLPGPQHLRDYVHDGKLQLSLHDAIVLTLENNSAIHVEEASVETAKFTLLGSYATFDPTGASGFLNSALDLATSDTLSSLPGSAVTSCWRTSIPWR